MIPAPRSHGILRPQPRATRFRRILCPQPPAARFPGRPGAQPPEPRCPSLLSPRLPAPVPPARRRAVSTTPRTRPTPSRRRSTGLTLVETLVTFVILGFLSTLILQAVAFFAARYDGVQRVHRVAALEALQQNYFATSVRGLIPYGVKARRFRGDATFFEGITLEPLRAEPGLPVTARWAIDEDTIRYAESPAPGVDGTVWTVLDESDAATFEYADSLGNWFDHWPPQAARPTGDPANPVPHQIYDPAYDWVPTLIRLVTPEQTVWLARVEPSRRPVITEDSYR